MELLEPDNAVTTASNDLVLTTYGRLRPGQAYRIPGNERWYHRSKNARPSEQTSERVVETIAE
jgi:hypothetical protein